MPTSFSAGDNVLVQALVASYDVKKGMVKVAIGFGPNRSIITVPAKLLERPVPKAIREAASWATDLYGHKD